MNYEDKIEFNIKAHDKTAATYDRNHDEIFNDIEQGRLRSVLEEVIDAVKSNEKSLKALDVGCGSGNLTRHLIDLGVHTVSADVSEGFLRLVEERFSSTGLCETLKLNGKDLANIKDQAFDIAAAYSVLHHVPDYLHSVREMCRVLKPGGVIYVDHEANETYYNKPPEYAEFLRLAVPKTAVLKKYLPLLFSFGFYIRFIRKRLDPRYQKEGDIHVWPDDHIEWDKIEQLLVSQGFEVVVRRAYLACKSSYRRNVYEQYKNRCNDTAMLLARKK